MGTCWNCEKEVFLKEEETRCDNCGEIVRYWCHNCHNPFDVEDKDKKKLHECKWCYFFLCPHCGVCGPDCEKYEHLQKIKDFVPQITEEQGQKILTYFEEIKNGKIQRICEFGVPKTYAKHNIKNILAKMQGFRVKDNIDMDAFTKRMKFVELSSEGKIFTIKSTKEPGSYGDEWRDIFNLCVCLGILKWKKEPIMKEGEKIGEYDCWSRKSADSKPCPNIQINNIIVKYCPKCLKIFSSSEQHCLCYQYKKGKLKGQYPELREKLSNIPTCSALNKFQKRGNAKNNRRGDCTSNCFPKRESETEYTN